MEFRFYDKEQCKKFMAAWMEMECTGSDNIKYEVIIGDSLTLDEHWITIDEGVWANNLSNIAKILEEIDYKSSV